MKKSIILFSLAIFGLLLSCNNSKEKPVNAKSVDLESSISSDEINYSQDYTINAEPVTDIKDILKDTIELFELDSINIILDKGTYLPRYLPEKDTIIKLTNKTLFECISSSEESYNNYKATVKIIENSEVPFCKYQGDMGFGSTDVSFYYKVESILMHLDHALPLAPFNREEYDDEELIEYMSNNTEELIFDVVFKKAPLPPGH